MNKLFLGLIALGGSLAANTASAATLIGQEPNASVIVTRGNLEWVYASPCAGQSPSCGTPTLHHDFEFASNDQWLSSFNDLADLVAAFTKSDGAALCAATYFSSAYDHCDLGDLTSGYVWNSPFAASPDYARNGAAETFLVRVKDGEPVGVPEPAALALFGLGIAGLGMMRRRKTA